MDWASTETGIPRWKFHLYPMHGSTSIIADILVLSTSILRAADPVLRVPSGHTQTKNLSTHLKEGISFITLLCKQEKFCKPTWHFLWCSPTLSSLSQAHSLKAETLLASPIFYESIIDEHIFILMDSHIGLPRSVLSKAAWRDLPNAEAEEQGQWQHPPVTRLHLSGPLDHICPQATHLFILWLRPRARETGNIVFASRTIYLLTKNS